MTFSTIILNGETTAHLIRVCVSIHNGSLYMIGNDNLGDF